MRQSKARNARGSNHYAFPAWAFLLSELLSVREADSLKVTVIRLVRR